MSFFNKMLSFTEWRDTVDQLDDAMKARKKYMENYNQSMETPYVEFVRKQPLEINDVLFRINDRQKQVCQQHKEELDAIHKLRADLEKLRPINDNIKSKRKQYEKIKEQSEKSAKVAEKADQKLNSLRASGTGTPEFKKAEDAAEVAHRQKETDQANYEEAERKIKVDNAEYKKRFFQELMSAIGQYASSRASLCDPQVSVGQDLSSNGHQIPNYNDSSVDKLKARLQSLRAEPIE